MSASMSPPPPGGMMPPDPSAGDPSAGGDDSSNVIVSICSNGDGSYTVYAGSPPDSDSDDSSDDDTDAMGPAGGAPAAGAGGGAGGAGAMGGGMGGASQGQPADSIGAALKIALDLLNADKSSEGAPGNADDQLASGFSASKSPTPATGPAQKY
jgi:hypothetical protein